MKGARRGLVGRVLGDRYRIVGVLSAGSSVLIADAEDLKLQRAVSIKLIRPEIAESAEFRRKFVATMRAMAKLSHPNIAAVYDWGEERIGKRTTVYAVVEQLTGGSLRDLFDRGRRLDPSQALLVGLEACRALDYAHRKHLVHTEITPSKLVFGDDRRLRIVDFGLARLLASRDWQEPSTVPTHVARYASPEQALGQPLDGKSDVYSLALVLVEAVTGEVPFAARSTVATLSARVGRLMPVSADLGPLAAVLERAGRPDPADRSTAAELGRGLVRAASKLPRPKPIPILARSVFEEDPSQLRRPNDPTGGVRRPPPEPVVPLVPPVPPPAEPAAPRAAAAPTAESPTAPSPAAESTATPAPAEPAAPPEPAAAPETAETATVPTDPREPTVPATPEEHAAGASIADAGVSAATTATEPAAPSVAPAPPAVAPAGEAPASADEDVTAEDAEPVAEAPDPGPVGPPAAEAPEPDEAEADAATVPSELDADTGTDAGSAAPTAVGGPEDEATVDEADEADDTDPLDGAAQEAAAPATTDPPTTGPDASVPEGAEQAVTEPVTTESVTTGPDASGPQGAEQAVAEPEAAAPATPSAAGAGEEQDDVDPATRHELAALAKPPAGPQEVLAPPPPGEGAVTVAAPGGTAPVEPPGEPGSTGRRWLPWVIGVLVIGALGALGLLAYTLFKVPTHPVPDLVGLDEQAARAEVADFDWNIEIRRARSDEHPTPGEVIETAPPAGARLAEDEPFLIVVSEGPELRTLVDLTGMTLAEAETQLAKQRLVALPPIEEHHEEVPEGSVISWSVPDDESLGAGSQVLPETEIQLVISAGPAPRTIPEVVGRTVEEATAALEELQLEVEVAEAVFHDEIPAGSVVSVDPPEGTEGVERGSTVTITPSKGVDLVTVPNVIGLDLTRARDALGRAGLRVGSLLGNSQGVVVEARVAGDVVEAGDEVKRGSTVDLALF